MGAARCPLPPLSHDALPSRLPRPPIWLSIPSHIAPPSIRRHHLLPFHSSVHHHPPWSSVLVIRPSTCCPFRPNTDQSGPQPEAEGTTNIRFMAVQHAATDRKNWRESLRIDRGNKLRVCKKHNRRVCVFHSEINSPAFPPLVSPTLPIIAHPVVCDWSGGGFGRGLSVEETAVSET